MSQGGQIVVPGGGSVVPPAVFGTTGQSPNYLTFSQLTTGGAAGNIAWTSDAGLCQYNGTAWAAVGGFINSAEGFGASPTATGAVNTAAINAALSLGGTVTLNKPGTYTIDKSATVTRPTSGALVASCLVIPSNTKFVVGAGVTLKVLAGLVNPCLISNANALANGTDSNITIQGGIWDGNSDNVTRVDVAGSEMPCIHIWIQGVTNINCRDMTVVNPRSWGFGVANCTNGYFDNTRFQYTCAVTVNQGGFQFEGPNNDIIVRNTFGNPYDDLVAFVTDATTLYANTMGGFGAANDIIIDGVVSDETAGCLHHMRLQDSTTNPISRVKINNVTGPYTDGGIMLSNQGTSQLNNISIDGLSIGPLTGKNPANGTIQVANNVYSLQINNWHRLYSDGNESTKRPCIATIGTINNLNITNFHVRDSTAAGAGVAFINASTGSIGDLLVTNFECIVGVAGGSNIFAQMAASGNIGRAKFVNFSTIRMANLINIGGSGSGLVQALQVSNYYGFANQAPFIKTTASVACPLIQLTNVRLDSTQGGASGCIAFTGLSGTCLIQAYGCSFNNGGSANIVRSASESIRVQSMDLPVPNAVLTAAVGDIFLDSSNSNNPYRCSVAPSTFVAL